MDRVNLSQKITKKELGHERAQNNITEDICDLLRQQATPGLGTDVFNANPVDFHNFIADFKEVVENNVTDSGRRLTCLIKFTKREAEEIVKSCIQLLSEVGFKVSKQLFTSIFRDSYIITSLYCKEIK